MRSLFLCIAVLVHFLCFLLVTAATSAQNWGKFEGQFAGAFTGQGWQFKLSENLTYFDPVGKRWVAPKDAVVDGASIPRIFWTGIGAPFEGDYRNASAVHDVACVKRSEPWREVHRMFYYAMRGGGVSELQAAIMYAAVYQFGPRWREPQGFWVRLRNKVGDVFSGADPEDVPPPPPPPPPETEADVQALHNLIEGNQPKTPEEIERLMDSMKR